MSFHRCMDPMYQVCQRVPVSIPVYTVGASFRAARLSVSSARQGRQLLRKARNCCKQSPLPSRRRSWKSAFGGSQSNQRLLHRPFRVWSGANTQPLEEGEKLLTVDRPIRARNKQARKTDRRCLGVLPGLDLESRRTWIETQQHAAADLIIPGGNGNVLGGGVHVAQAALEAVALVNRGTPTSLVHEVNDLRRCRSSPCVGQPYERPLAHRGWPPTFHFVPQLLHGLEQESTRGSQQRLGASHVGLHARLVAQENGRPHRCLGLRQVDESIDGSACNPQGHRG